MPIFSKYLVLFLALVVPFHASLAYQNGPYLNRVTFNHPVNNNPNPNRNTAQPVVEAYSPKEKITDFSSVVKINADSSMIVTETISAIADNAQIKHGIYRDFPTYYQDASGNTITVGFDVLGVTRDNQSIPYSLVGIANGERIYMGDKNVPIATGPHVFALTYKTTRQLGYFKDYDELYWNVTGNGWVFPIDRATAQVILPPSGKLLQQFAYTGPVGAQGKDYTVGQDAAGNVIFATTRPLAAHEGLTIAVAWPKGLVYVPTSADKLRYFLQDNWHALVGGAMAVCLLFYFVAEWWRHGRGPKKGVIIPLFTPPDNLTPALLNTVYFWLKAQSSAAFPSTLVNLAVKGYIKITQTEKEILGFHLPGKTYAIQQLRDDVDALPNIEKLLLLNLLGDAKEMTFDMSNSMVVSTAARLFGGVLKQDVDGVYYAKNAKYMGIGFLGAFIITTIVSSGHSHAGFIVFPLFLITIIFIMLLRRVPTPQGRQLLDKIEGFKMYLSVAEKNRLNMLTSPKMTPEVFEKYLPYAMALGVANQWGSQFEAAMATGEYPAYAPVWYAGNDWNVGNVGGFTESFSSGLGNAVASAGGASGSSGGGGSGGGGGGGGGGGF